jgi:nucleoside-diphosphate-sugar epimerase
MKKPTAVITCAAGFLGSHLTDRLLDEGWKVIAIR